LCIHSVSRLLGQARRSVRADRCHWSQRVQPAQPVPRRNRFDRSHRRAADRSRGWNGPTAPRAQPAPHGTGTDRPNGPRPRVQPGNGSDRATGIDGANGPIGVTGATGPLGANRSRLARQAPRREPVRQAQRADWKRQAPVGPTARPASDGATGPTGATGTPGATGPTGANGTLATARQVRLGATARWREPVPTVRTARRDQPARRSSPAHWC
jgi:hypothetical protein